MKTAQKVIAIGLGVSAVAGGLYALSRAGAQAAPAPKPTPPTPTPGITALNIQVTKPSGMRDPRVYIDGGYKGDGSFVWQITPGQHVVSFEAGASIIPPSGSGVDHYQEPQPVAVNAAQNQTVVVSVSYTAVKQVPPDISLVSLFIDSTIVLDQHYIVGIAINNPTNATQRYYAELLLGTLPTVYGGGPIQGIPPGSWSTNLDFSVPIGGSGFSLGVYRVWVKFYAVDSQGARTVIKLVNSGKDVNVVYNPIYNPAPASLAQQLQGILPYVFKLFVWQDGVWKSWIPGGYDPATVSVINVGDDTAIYVIVDCTITSTGRKLSAGYNRFNWP